jgi:hypothetical protein
VAGGHEAQWFSEYFQFPGDEEGLFLDPIFLLPAISISGNIQDSAPAASQRLCLRLVGTSFQDTADANGNFAFDRIPVGNFLFSVSAISVDTVKTTNIVLIGDTGVFPASMFLTITSASAYAMVSRDVSRDTVTANAAIAVSPTEAAQDTGTGLITLTYKSYRINYSVTQNP